MESLCSYHVLPVEYFLLVEGDFRPTSPNYDALSGRTDNTHTERRLLITCNLRAQAKLV